MASNRRSFLQMAGVVPAAAAAALTGTRMAQAATNANDSALTRSAFAACRGEDFAFELSAFEHLAVRLAKVEPLDALAQGDDGEHRFSLRFEAPAGRGLAQESYRVTHPRLGRFVMFVSPRDAEGRAVEAVFNRA
jgi:hypothetical protein